MLSLIFLPAALIIPVMSIVWVNILTQPGGIFAFASRWCIRCPEWVRKPLFDCVPCNTGQIAFWTFLGYYGINPYIIPFVLTTIYISKLIPQLNDE